MLDFTTDKTSGLAPIQMFTLKDKAFTENHLSGVGVKSGEVATAVAGEKYIVSGLANIKTGVTINYSNCWDILIAA